MHGEKQDQPASTEPQFLTVLVSRESDPAATDVEGVVLVDFGETVRLEVGPDMRLDFDARELRAALGTPGEGGTQRRAA